MKQTTKLEIEEFNNWVAESINGTERILRMNKEYLESCLNGKITILKDKFENIFECEYYSIRWDMDEAKRKAAETNIPEEVLDMAIKEFKQMKSKVRKAKAEYKKAFEELRESINQSVEDEAYVQKNEMLVANTVKAWCDTHEIPHCMKDQFTGEMSQEQIHRLTMGILTSRLYPNEDEVREVVENSMESRAERMAYWESIKNR